MPPKKKHKLNITSVEEITSSPEVRPEPEEQPVEEVVIEEIPAEPVKHEEEPVPIQKERCVVYLCGPVSGFDLTERQLMFGSAEMLLGRLLADNYDVYVINPLLSIAPDGSQTFDEYLRTCIKQLADATMICLLPGWNSTLAGELEKQVADGLGIPSIDYMQFYGGREE